MSKLVNVFDTIGKHIPGIAANYVKRMLEPVYDRVFSTRLGRYFKSLDRKEKYAVEASMYVATEILEPKLEGDAPFTRVVREVVMDAGPELAKRMLNGPDPPTPPADSKEEGWPVVETMTEDIKKLRQKLRH